MRQSQTLIPTLREAPADAELISHQLLVRAGYIRKLASGVYSYLPLGLRVLQKIENIIREEMLAEGAQELLLPIVMPAELWRETKRWDYYGRELLRFKDRNDRDFCIGPTHEEAITDLVRKNVNSYRQLPLNLFQIQTKFRDEIRPRFGLMRGREFIMKDGYSFDVDEAAAHQTYQKMFRAYQKIFTRCGLDFRPVEAMTGAIGGSLSHEFQVLAGSGEDPVLASDTSDYAANVEKAPLNPELDLSKVEKRKGRLEKISTPGRSSVEEVAEFLGIATQELMKIILFETNKGLIGALVRGDHELVEAKLQAVSGADQLKMASERTIRDQLKSAVGYTGPMGLAIPLYADFAVAGMADFVTGSNEKDFHLKKVNLGDFNVEGFFDLRRARAGDPCPHGGKYVEHRGIEVGQIFFLGTKYSQAMGARYKDEAGTERLMVMGCYGIGVGRTAAAAIEQNHDGNGIVWPYPIAPFQFHLLSLNLKDEAVAGASEKIYRDLCGRGLEVLWDDRDENPGVKFKDGDLLGIPFRLVVGPRGLQENKIEIKDRKSGEVQKIDLDKLGDYLWDLHQAELALEQ
jgi:prolyl-tRNA synthetase